MDLRKLSYDYDLDYNIKRGQSFSVEVKDNCNQLQTVCQDKVNSDVKIEGLVTFREGGFFEPWSGFGCYLGTKKSVQNFEKHIGI